MGTWGCWCCSCLYLVAGASVHAHAERWSAFHCNRTAGAFAVTAARAAFNACACIWCQRRGQHCHEKGVIWSLSRLPCAASGQGMLEGNCACPCPFCVAQKAEWQDKSMCGECRTKAKWKNCMRNTRAATQTSIAKAWQPAASSSAFWCAIGTTRFTHLPGNWQWHLRLHESN